MHQCDAALGVEHGVLAGRADAARAQLLDQQ
jgi:hypothetical protein